MGTAKGSERVYTRVGRGKDRTSTLAFQPRTKRPIRYSSHILESSGRVSISVGIFRVQYPEKDDYER